VVDQVVEFQGAITEFKLDSGKIQLEDGRALEFKAADFLEQIDDLSDYPAVYCQVENGRAVKIRKNPDLIITKPVRSGHAVLGAAKCPQCHWRLPMRPAKEQSALRKGDVIECPECQTPLVLNSFVSGFHGSFLIGLIAMFFIWNRGIRMYRRAGFSNPDPDLLAAFTPFFYLTLISLFFWIFWQEKLLRADDI